MMKISLRNTALLLTLPCIASLSSPSPPVSRCKNAANQQSLVLDRRNLISTVTLAVLTVGTVAWKTQNSVELPATATPVMSLEDAVSLIDAECDRRFLHGIVASGYQLMYKAVPKLPGKLSMPSIQQESGGVILPQMEDRLINKPLQPSNSFLTWTSSDDARVWRNEVVSVWPLGADAHFAWVEGGGTFGAGLADKSIIVDGIDCGREALEDALEAERSQILVRAERYLAVPVSMEADLLAKLQSSFLI